MVQAKLRKRAGIYPTEPTATKKIGDQPVLDCFYLTHPETGAVHLVQSVWSFDTKRGLTRERRALPAFSPSIGISGITR